MSQHQAAVKKLFLDLQRCTDESIALSGHLNLPKMVTLLEPALADERNRKALCYAFAKFIGEALDGTVINVHNWTPPPPPK